MVKAIQAKTAGDADILQWVELDLPAPAAGQVQIRHTAIGVNLIDIYHRSATEGQYNIERPATLGVEAAGVVLAVGAGVTGVTVGQRVCYWMTLGAYAEVRNIPAERLVPLPDDISDDVAAAAMVKASTASYLLNKVFPVKKGDWVLVHAAAGGVGQLLCQWARHLGAHVIGSVGSEAKKAVAQAAGCEHVFLHGDPDFSTAVKEWSGGGVHAVFDSIGQSTFTQSISSLRPLGMMVCFGQASGPVAPLDISLLAKHGSIFLAKPTLATFTATPAALKELAESVFQALRDGAIKVNITQRLPLQDAAQAHRLMESRATTGAMVLLP